MSTITFETLTVPFGQKDVDRLQQTHVLCKSNFFKKVAAMELFCYV
jgi:hypothetical protein